MRSVPTGIVVVSGLFGPSSVSFRERTTTLRGEGYHVSAVDLFVDGAPPATPDNLRKRAELAAAIKYEAVAGRIEGTADSLRQNNGCEQVAFLGFGCGGTAALHAASRPGVRVDLVIAWYPHLTTVSLADVESPVQLYYGGDTETTESAEMALAVAAFHPDFRVDVTRDVGYGFAEPQLQGQFPNSQYDPDAASTTWRNARYRIYGLALQPQAA